MNKVFRTSLLLFCLSLFSQNALFAQAQQLERLDRGMVAVKTSTGVFISWRMLNSDNEQTSFNIYRNDVLMNSTPYTTVTNVTDVRGTTTTTYTLEVLEDDVPTGETYGPVSVWSKQYLVIPTERPAGGTNASGDYTYSPNDCSVGDVDGDGEYEIILKWDPSNAKDNSQSGYTGNVLIDCYKMNGTKLWRLDLGCNIRAGAHYTQFMVYDLDGDGKAEVACKTAPGTIDGLGNYVLMGNDSPTADYRNSGGYILSGPEYLTVFNGETGAELTTVKYNPLRSIHTHDKKNTNVTVSWGDDYGNRCDRFLACVAYLDGEKPSLVMCRGYYSFSHLVAYDFDGDTLIQRWSYASPYNKEAFGQGTHSLSVADVDGDGCDEIIYGSATIDNNGKCKYSTGLGHGDALHVSDMNPDRDGLEIFMPHESTPYGVDLHAGETGSILFRETASGDTGRGLAADIDSRYRGFEMWSTGSSNVYTCNGVSISTSRPSVNFRIYWDGDLYDELLDGTNLDKWTGSGTSRLMSFYNYNNATACNSTKNTPNLSADIIGDWREEVILWDANTCNLLLFTTVTASKYRVPTLMHDRTYRMAIAWQNVAYNQPPHLGYFLPDMYRTTFEPIEGSGALDQEIALGDSITPIIYHYENATGAYAYSLPAGVSYTKDAESKNLIISGTPTATGTKTFTMRTSGADENIILTGTITVTIPDGIQQIETDDTHEEVIYDLNGRRVTAPIQGLYIINGKKVYIQ